jgi:hypothetical protein
MQTRLLRVCPSSSTSSRELALACIILAAVSTISPGSCSKFWTEETHADISFRYCRGVLEYIHQYIVFKGNKQSLYWNICNQAGDKNIDDKRVKLYD